MSDYFDLGSYTRSVTGSEPAQTWFNRGLLWAYGFNHEEAVACFERATKADPGCVMGYWGHAYALGPNYNKPWAAFSPGEAFSSLSLAAAVLDMAKSRADQAAPAEGMLVRALSMRYPVAGSPFITGLSVADLAARGPDWLAEQGAGWNTWYAEGMRDVYQRYPEDLDVAALFADALLNLTPWALWDRVTGEPAPGAAAVEAKDVLERALASPGGGAHPGILHMYIHLMETVSYTHLRAHET